MSHSRYVITLIALTLLLVLLALACLVFGSVDIPVDRIIDIVTGKGSGNKAWDIIILQSRIPMIITAALAGAALSVSGLLLQTTFNNPLAGPSILGVSSGAGLGVLSWAPGRCLLCSSLSRPSCAATRCCSLSVSS